MTNKKNMSKCAVTGAFTLLFIFILPAAAFARELVPVGHTVGIEVHTAGVLVAGLSGVATAAGEATPAADAGILPGDIIIRMGKNEIGSADDFLAAADTLDGSPVAVTLQRGAKLIQYTVMPAADAGGGWKLGLFLRDGISGIGTITFYDPETGLFGALGHPINDSETGVMLPLGEGFITSASIVSVQKGENGAPGELHGCFDVSIRLGSILYNTPYGIFGYSDTVPEGTALETVPSNEIRTGPATIIAQVAGSDTQEFDVEICRIYRGGEERLMVSVTDPELLNLTGGIVQGMSGSPIIQNGRLVGAVTHVLLSDPTRGYGVTIDSMLGAADAARPEDAAA
ncbi:MAG: SpoIVB peptidase [Clostridia bacterium]|nr:SpoIVB peptidase [Clostridia bacterium]NCC68495.1 SpoIVB peptidase [Clostridia bacterium]